MTEVVEGNIRVKVLEMIPLDLDVKPKQFLLSYQIIDGNKRLPPVRRIVTERDNIKSILKHAIAVYLSIKDFLEV